MKRGAFLLMAIAIAVSSCKKEECPDDIITGSVCDTTYYPIVMCHGFLASGDTYAGQVKRFIQNDYCSNSTYVFDWNSLGGGSSVNELDAFIDQVLASTSATKVELVGHSAGGGLGYDYLSDATRAAMMAPGPTTVLAAAPVVAVDQAAGLGKTTLRPLAITSSTSTAAPLWWMLAATAWMQMALL